MHRFYGKHGRLAQLVQSICLTSRGSAVRIRQRPRGESSIGDSLFLGVDGFEPGGGGRPLFLLLFCYAKALHFIPLGGPPGPHSRSRHSLAPIRLYLRIYLRLDLRFLPVYYLGEVEAYQLFFFIQGPDSVDGFGLGIKNIEMGKHVQFYGLYEIAVPVKEHQFRGNCF